MVTSRDGGSHDNVIATSGTSQQNSNEALKDHVQGETVFLTPGEELIHGRAGNTEVVIRTTEGLEIGSGQIGGEFEEHGGILKVGLPEAKALVQVGTLKLLFLPDGEIAVLRRQFR